ncbi:hypothetical protein ACIRYZ_01375 [Kitasatospora sp. NPDC101155]
MQETTKNVELDLSFEELEAIEAPGSWLDKATNVVVIGGILTGIAVT